MGEPVPASDLLREHLEMLNREFSRRARRAIESEAESRGIDLSEYDFDQQAGAFVPGDPDDAEE